MVIRRTEGANNMFDQKKVKEEAINRHHEKVTLSNGMDIDIRTNMPQMPEMPETSAFDILSDVGVNMRKYSDGSSGDSDEAKENYWANETYDEKSTQNIIDMISSMDEREQGIVVSVLPVKLCLRRIEDELQRHMRFKDAVNEALQMN